MGNESKETKKVKRPLKVIAVCGVGMGTSQILKMSAEEALKELGIEAEVETCSLSLLTSTHPDVVLVGADLASSVSGIAPVVIPITNFGSTKEIKEKFVQFVDMN